MKFSTLFFSPAISALVEPPGIWAAVSRRGLMYKSSRNGWCCLIRLSTCQTFQLFQPHFSLPLWSPDLQGGQIFCFCGLQVRHGAHIKHSLLVYSNSGTVCEALSKAVACRSPQVYVLDECKRMTLFELRVQSCAIFATATTAVIIIITASQPAAAAAAGEKGRLWRR